MPGAEKSAPCPLQRCASRTHSYGVSEVSSHALSEVKVKCFFRHARLYLSANKLLSSQVTASVETSGILHKRITAAKFTESLMGLASNGRTSSAVGRSVRGQ